MQTTTLYSQGGMQQPLPNATGVLVLGILSIVFCCCYGVVGEVLGIIALVLAGKAKALYNSNPDAYTPASYKNMNAGRVCAIIGIILSSVYLLFCIWIIATVGIDALGNQELMQERMKEIFGQ